MKIPPSLSYRVSFEDLLDTNMSGLMSHQEIIQLCGLGCLDFERPAIIGRDQEVIGLEAAYVSAVLAVWPDFLVSCSAALVLELITTAERSSKYMPPAWVQAFECYGKAIFLEMATARSVRH